MIGSAFKLRQHVEHELHETGFVVMPGPVGPVEKDRLAQLAAAYDAAMRDAGPEDLRVGSTTTRVNDFVNRGPEFDEIYVYEPLLAACHSIFGEPFKLRTMLGRTLRPGTPADSLHVDLERDADLPRIVGFILMIDEFRNDNGATRFVPGSHNWPNTSPPKESADYPGQALALGPAGSLIVYDGSIWHGHTANRTSQPRRSIQGVYLRRNDRPWSNQAIHMKPETLSRIGDLAKYLLELA